MEGVKRPHKPRKGSKRKWVNVIPYYRRRLKSGATVLYLRFPDGLKKCIVVEDGTVLAHIKSGKPHTIEETYL